MHTSIKISCAVLVFLFFTGCRIQKTVYGNGLHLDWNGRGDVRTEGKTIKRFAAACTTPGKAPFADSSPFEQEQDTLVSGSVQADAPDAAEMHGFYKDLRHTAARNEIHVNGCKINRLTIQTNAPSQSLINSTDTTVKTSPKTKKTSVGKMFLMLGGGMSSGVLAVFLLLLQSGALLWLALIFAIISLGLLMESVSVAKTKKAFSKALVYLLAWPVIVASAIVMLICTLLLSLQKEELD